MALDDLTITRAALLHTLADTLKNEAEYGPLAYDATGRHGVVRFIEWAFSPGIDAIRIVEACDPATRTRLASWGRAVRSENR